MTETQFVSCIRRSLSIPFKEHFFLEKVHPDQFAQIGAADLIGCIFGLYVAIEAKVGRGRLSQEQINWLNSVYSKGGLAVVLHLKNDHVYLITSGFDTYTKNITSHHVLNWLGNDTSSTGTLRFDVSVLFSMLVVKASQAASLTKYIAENRRS